MAKQNKTLSQAEALEQVALLLSEMVEHEIQFNMRYRFDVKTFTFTASHDANAVKFFFPEFKVLPNQARDGFYAVLDIQHI